MGITSHLSIWSWRQGRERSRRGHARSSGRALALSGAKRANTATWFDTLPDLMHKANTVPWATLICLVTRPFSVRVANVGSIRPYREKHTALNFTSFLVHAVHRWNCNWQSQVQNGRHYFEKAATFAKHKQPILIYHLLWMLNLRRKTVII